MAAQADTQFGTRPNTTSPAASSPPDSRLAPRDPRRCSAAAVTGKEKMAPSAANSSTPLTCEVLRPRLALMAGRRDVQVP
jgi:hypothetical protein